MKVSWKYIAKLLWYETTYYSIIKFNSTTYASEEADLWLELPLLDMMMLNQMMKMIIWQVQLNTKKLEEETEDVLRFELNWTLQWAIIKDNKLVSVELTQNRNENKLRWIVTIFSCLNIVVKLNIYRKSMKIE